MWRRSTSAFVVILFVATLSMLIVYWHCLREKQASVSSIAVATVNGRVNGEFGFVFASSYFDQITGSTANFLSMQCWASTLGPKVRVVEPFLVHSTFGVDLHAVSEMGESEDEATKSMAKLGDLYSMEGWADFLNYTSLVSWDFFLKKARQKLILVNRQCNDREEALVLCEDCIQLLDSLKFDQSSDAFAMRHGFEVVRKVCVPPALLTAEQFRRLVYGFYNPSEVAVLFESWGGVQQNELSIRVPLSNLQQCNRLELYHIMPFSEKILGDGEKYIEKYIPHNSYVAVMVRIQYIAIVNEFAKHSKGYIVSVLAKCFESILKEVNKAKALYNLESVLLTLDCRKQGSYYFKNSTDLSKTLADSTDILYRMLYGNSSTLMEWDESFELIASLHHPGYIATLQKHLAAKSSCLITAGTGSFQFMAQAIYLTYHSKEPQCRLDVGGRCGLPQE